MIKTHVLSKSVDGHPIHVYELESEGPAILIVSGIHGDEPQSAFVGDRLVDLMQTVVADMLRQHLLITPRLNPDGLSASVRANAHGVDLNRNFPTANWQRGEPQDPYYGGTHAGSEPETQLILELIRRFGVRRILTIHCIDRPGHCVNYDGPAKTLADLMAAHNSYDVRRDIGHATPGSLGTWAGFERKIPTVTLELPAEQDEETCWQDNRDAIMNFIQAEFDE